MNFVEVAPSANNAATEGQQIMSNRNRTGHAGGGSGQKIDPCTCKVSHVRLTLWGRVVDHAQELLLVGIDHLQQLRVLFPQLLQGRTLNQQPSSSAKALSAKPSLRDNRKLITQDQLVINHDSRLLHVLRHCLHVALPAAWAEESVGWPGQFASKPGTGCCCEGSLGCHPQHHLLLQHLLQAQHLLPEPTYTSASYSSISQRGCGRGVSPLPGWSSVSDGMKTAKTAAEVCIPTTCRLHMQQQQAVTCPPEKARCSVHIATWGLNMSSG